MKLNKIEEFILGLPSRIAAPFKKLKSINYKEIFSKEAIKKSFHQQSITKRWLVNIFSVIALIIFAVCVATIVIIRSYYNNSVEEYLTNRMNVITAEISRLSYSSQTNHNAEVRNLVETFEDKDRIELMAIDRKGEVSVTSSGFDFEDTGVLDTQYTNDGVINTFELATGEKVMSLTTSIDESPSEFVALTMITSLEGVEKRCFFFSLIVAVVSLCLLGLIFAVNS